MGGGGSKSDGGKGFANRQKKKEQQEEGLRALIGWYGTTVSRCNPSGKAMIGDRIYGGVSSTTWLDEDTEIEVESVHENALIVKPRVG